MHLTKATGYALRLLIFVGNHQGRLCNISEIANTFHVPESHMMKITHQLALSGVIETVRGKGGGMRSAKPPQSIVLGDVIRLMEPDFHIVECFSTTGQCRIDSNCRLASVLNDALSDFLSRLDGYTLADILLPISHPVRFQK